MERHDAIGGISQWKVNNPGMSNHIVQMRSGGFQPPFYMGGSQVPINLGIKGNNNTSTTVLPTRTTYSATERVIRKAKK